MSSKQNARRRYMSEIEADNIPLGTNEIIHIDDIIIPMEYANTKPRTYKVQDAVKYFVKYGVIDKPITVIAETNENGEPPKFILVDEYARYLALVKWCGFNYVPVRYIDINTYFKEYRNL